MTMQFPVALIAIDTLVMIWSYIITMQKMIGFSTREPTTRFIIGKFTDDNQNKMTASIPSI